MNLGPLKDRSKHRKSLVKTIGKQGVYAIAFTCMAVVGIVLAVTLGGPSQQAEAGNSTLPVISATPRPTPDKGVSGPGDVVVPQQMLLPVNGTVLKGHSTESLVFNATMNEWSTHNGIDISCSAGDKVVAVLDGTVEKAQADYLMGNVVVINHGDGLKTVYAGLDTIDDSIKTGDTVSAGREIGTAGNTALSEISDGVHLHFEVLKDGRNADPMDYLDDTVK